MSRLLVRAGRLVVVLAVAAPAGVAVVVASALIGHAVLVRMYGENLAPIDDTLPMVVATWVSYLAGALAALVVIVVGWRRFIRR